MHVLVIGGSDAGISAALRIRELDPAIEVSVMLRDGFPNYSICGLPFLISGETTAAQSLAHRTSADLQAAGLQVRTHCDVIAVNPSDQRVDLADGDSVAYDRLILATGARSRRPELEGVDLPGVFTLRWMGDALRMLTVLEEQQPRRALIVGGGYIGLEMADALHTRGLQVTLIEHNPAVLRTVHPSFGDVIQSGLRARGITVRSGLRLAAIRQSHQALEAVLNDGQPISTDLVLLAVGAVPANELAASAGVSLGAGGAMVVDRQMRTGVASVWAAGDGVETYHRLLGRNVYQPLGTNSHKQGRIAGENAIGGNRLYPGTLGTQVVKVFDRVVARTGLRDQEARLEGLDPLTVPFECSSHKAYYPGAGRLHFRITGDRRDGHLLGAQLMGPWGEEVSKRVDTFANALFHGMNVDAISDLDLSYTPPLSSPWDPVQMAAQAWEGQCRTLASATIPSNS